MDEAEIAEGYREMDAKTAALNREALYGNIEQIDRLIAERDDLLGKLQRARDGFWEVIQQDNTRATSKDKQPESYTVLDRADKMEAIARAVLADLRPEENPNG